MYIFAHAGAVVKLTTVRCSLYHLSIRKGKNHSPHGRLPHNNYSGESRNLIKEYAGPLLVSVLVIGGLKVERFLMVLLKLMKATIMQEVYYSRSAQTIFWSTT